MMPVDESSDTDSLLDYPAFQRKNRITAGLLAAVCGVATWYSVQALRDVYVTDAGSLLHPSRALVRAIASLAVPALSTAYFAWSAVVGYPWITDGEDPD